LFAQPWGSLENLRQGANKKPNEFGMSEDSGKTLDYVDCGLFSIAIGSGLKPGDRPKRRFLEIGKLFPAEH